MKLYKLCILLNFIFVIWAVLFVVLVCFYPDSDLKTLLIESEISRIIEFICLVATMIMFFYNLKICRRIYPQYVPFLYSYNIVASPIIANLIIKKMKRFKKSK